MTETNIQPIQIEEERGTRYNPHAFEVAWQEKWEKAGLYTFQGDPERPAHYALTMFPYPSGNLHMGHWYAYVAPDTRARWLRMNGHNVLFPMGFDAFGLPAENAAIKRGLDPKTWTYGNIADMTGQFRRMGTMIDWSRQFNTCDPSYYRWNQWFFTEMFRRGLAYKKNGLVNWCPKDQTVLANEQVVNGHCERCGTAVERRELAQWYLKITDYADELLDFSQSDMPERVKTMQINWIGRSVGAEIDFDTPAGVETVFTTRPDTVMGATFLVLAPEHRKVAALTTPEQQAAVTAYTETAGGRTDVERQSATEKTGVFTGSYATHPISGHQLPIWIADYVLVTYGTGSIMAVPSGDQRDLDFARRYGLEVVETVRPEGSEPLDTATITEAYSGDGVIVNEGVLHGMQGGKAHIGPVTEKLSELGVARARTTYRLRDWLISRQRFWGTPIPIVYCPEHGPQPVPEGQLPVLLPDHPTFTPAGQSPLKTDEAYRAATCPVCGGVAERDTDTMDTFVDSSWYMYRFLNPHLSTAAVDAEASRRFMPIDLYTGGIEHAILHLLYSRFWTRVMRDMGLVEQSEPFKVVRNQGIILAADGEKMSKSRGNVVDPGDLVREYGVDTVRTYLMFIAPWEVGGPWDPSGINGPAKWLSRVYTLFADEQAAGPAESISEADLRYLVHSTLKKVGGDFERLSFNTIISSLMELTNGLMKAKRSPLYGTPAWDEALNTFNLMLAPIAPHLAEELWQRGGERGSVHLASWPAVEEAAATRDSVTIGVQVSGKVRGQVQISKTASQEEAMAAARAEASVAKFLEGKETLKEIYVPGKIINIVVRG
ncbi:leucine--tRNA ligase [Deinococcus sp.]|uniref:leucine--tRNA ligase n=1 Tax=Deinococcus sp. TaxID=47478 RepID=UPI003C7B523D